MESNENFPQLVYRYQDTIFRLAYSYTKNHFDADDVTQNVLLQLYKTDKAFESEAHLKNWLMCVTVNQCKNLFRAPWRKHENLEDYSIERRRNPFRATPSSVVCGKALSIRNMASGLKE